MVRWQAGRKTKEAYDSYYVNGSKYDILVTNIDDSGQEINKGLVIVDHRSDFLMRPAASYEMKRKPDFTELKADQAVLIHVFL